MTKKNKEDKTSDCRQFIKRERVRCVNYAKITTLRALYGTTSIAGASREGLNYTIFYCFYIQNICGLPMLSLHLYLY